MNMQISKHQTVFKSIWPSSLRIGDKLIPPNPLSSALKSSFSFSMPAKSVLGSSLAGISSLLFYLLSLLARISAGSGASVANLMLGCCQSRSIMRALDVNIWSIIGCSGDFSMHNKSSQADVPGIRVSDSRDTRRDVSRSSIVLSWCNTCSNIMIAVSGVLTGKIISVGFSRASSLPSVVRGMKASTAALTIGSSSFHPSAMIADVCGRRVAKVLWKPFR